MKRSAAAETQISAYISERTNELVDRYVRAKGIKKAYLVEEALLHHLNALHELPADIIIPPRIGVSREVYERVSASVKKPRRPTKALRELMSGSKKER